MTLTYVMLSAEWVKIISILITVAKFFLPSYMQFPSVPSSLGFPSYQTPSLYAPSSYHGKIGMVEKLFYWNHCSWHKFISGYYAHTINLSNCIVGDIVWLCGLLSLELPLKVVLMVSFYQGPCWNFSFCVVLSRECWMKKLFCRKQYGYNSPGPNKSFLMQVWMWNVWVTKGADVSVTVLQFLGCKWFRVSYKYLLSLKQLHKWECFSLTLLLILPLFILKACGYTSVSDWRGRSLLLFSSCYRQFIWVRKEMCNVALISESIAKTHLCTCEHQWLAK